MFRVKCLQIGTKRGFTQVVVIDLFSFYCIEYMNLKLAYSLMIAGAILCLPACKKDPVVEKHKQTSTSSSDNNSGENNGQQPSSPDKDAVLTRIEVVNPPVQTTYLLRSEVSVNLEGLVVEGIYSKEEAGHYVRESFRIFYGKGNRAASDHYYRGREADFLYGEGYRLRDKQRRSY